MRGETEPWRGLYSPQPSGGAGMDIHACPNPETDLGLVLNLETALSLSNPNPLPLADPCSVLYQRGCCPGRSGRLGLSSGADT